MLAGQDEPRLEEDAAGGGVVRVVLGSDLRQPEVAEGQGEDPAHPLGGVAPAPGVRAQDVADGGHGTVPVELDDAEEVAVDVEAEHVQRAGRLCRSRHDVAHAVAGFGSVHRRPAQVLGRLRAVDPRQGLGVTGAQLP
ncbi:hypothetical protein GCM10010519_30620 [Streptomyces lactacystinicus]